MPNEKQNLESLKEENHLPFISPEGSEENSSEEGRVSSDDSRPASPEPLSDKKPLIKKLEEKPASNKEQSIKELKKNFAWVKIEEMLPEYLKGNFGINSYEKYEEFLNHAQNLANFIQNSTTENLENYPHGTISEGTKIFGYKITEDTRTSVYTLPKIFYNQDMGNDLYEKSAIFEDLEYFLKLISTFRGSKEQRNTELTYSREVLKDYCTMLSAALIWNAYSRVLDYSFDKDDTEIIIVDNDKRLFTVLSSLYSFINNQKVQQEISLYNIITNTSKANEIQQTSHFMSSQHWFSKTIPNLLPFNTDTLSFEHVKSIGTGSHYLKVSLKNKGGTLQQAQGTFTHVLNQGQNLTLYTFKTMQQLFWKQLRDETKISIEQEQNAERRDKLVKEEVIKFSISEINNIYNMYHNIQAADSTKILVEIEAIIDRNNKEFNEKNILEVFGFIRDLEISGLYSSAIEVKHHIRALRQAGFPIPIIVYPYTVDEPFYLMNEQGEQKVIIVENHNPNYTVIKNLRTEARNLALLYIDLKELSLDQKEQITKLQDENQVLKNGIDSLNLELTSIEHSRLELEAKNISETQKLLAQQNRISELENKNCILEDEISSLNNDLNNIATNRLALEAKNLLERQKLLEQETNQLISNENYKKLREENPVLTKQVEDLQTENKNLQDKLKQAQNESAKDKEELEKARVIIQEKEKALTQVQVTIEALKKEYQELENTNSALLKKLEQKIVELTEQLTKEKEAYAKQTELLNKDNQELIDRNNTLQAEKERASKEALDNFEKLKLEISELNAKLKKEADEKLTIEKALQEAKEQISLKEKLILDLEDQHKLFNEAEILNIELVQDGTIVAERDRLQRELKQANEAHNQEKKRLEASNLQLENALKAKKAELTQAQNETAKNKEKLENASVTIQEKEKEKEKENALIQAQRAIDALNEANQELESTNAKYKAELDQNAELTKLESTNSELLKKLEQKIVELTEQLNQANERAAESLINNQTTQLNIAIVHPTTIVNHNQDKQETNKTAILTFSKTLKEKLDNEQINDNGLINAIKKWIFGDKRNNNKANFLEKLSGKLETDNNTSSFKEIYHQTIIDMVKEKEGENNCNLTFDDNFSYKNEAKFKEMKDIIKSGTFSHRVKDFIKISKKASNGTYSFTKLIEKNKSLKSINTHSI